MFELVHDGVETSTFAVLDYEGDFTRTRRFFNQDDPENAGEETLIFLPNGRRETGLVIAAAADGTVTARTRA